MNASEVASWNNKGWETRVIIDGCQYLGYWSVRPLKLLAMALVGPHHFCSYLLDQETPLIDGCQSMAW